MSQVITDDGKIKSYLKDHLEKVTRDRADSALSPLVKPVAAEEKIVAPRRGVRDGNTLVSPKSASLPAAKTRILEETARHWMDVAAVPQRVVKDEVSELPPKPLSTPLQAQQGKNQQQLTKLCETPGG